MNFLFSTNSAGLRVVAGGLLKLCPGSSEKEKNTVTSVCYEIEE